MINKKISLKLLGSAALVILIFLSFTMGEKRSEVQAQCVTFGLRHCSAGEGGVLSGYALIISSWGGVQTLTDPIYLCLTE